MYNVPITTDIFYILSKSSVLPSVSLSSRNITLPSVFCTIYVPCLHLTSIQNARDNSGIELRHVVLEDSAAIAHGHARHSDVIFDCNHPSGQLALWRPMNVAFPGPSKQ